MPAMLGHDQGVLLIAEGAAGRLVHVHLGVADELAVRRDSHREDPDRARLAHPPLAHADPLGGVLGGLVLDLLVGLVDLELGEQAAVGAQVLLGDLPDPLLDPVLAALLGRLGLERVEPGGVQRQRQRPAHGEVLAGHAEPGGDPVHGMGGILRVDARLDLAVRLDERAAGLLDRGQQRLLDQRGRDALTPVRGMHGDADGDRLEVLLLRREGHRAADEHLPALERLGEGDPAPHRPVRGVLEAGAQLREALLLMTAVDVVVERLLEGAVLLELQVGGGVQGTDRQLHARSPPRRGTTGRRNILVPP